jgi:hypothetical protein
MEGTINARRVLAATARLGDDGTVIYSQEGTPIQDRVFRVDQLHKLEMQLRCNGAFSEDVETFLGSLLTTGFAEIRRPKVMTKFFTI